MKGEVLVRIWSTGYFTRQPPIPRLLIADRIWCFTPYYRAAVAQGAVWSEPYGTWDHVPPQSRNLSIRHYELGRI